MPSAMIFACCSVQHPQFYFSAILIYGMRYKSVKHDFYDHSRREREAALPLPTSQKHELRAYIISIIALSPGSTTFASIARNHQVMT